jgi:hypothetical protein
MGSDGAAASGARELTDGPPSYAEAACLLLVAPGKSSQV